MCRIEFGLRRLGRKLSNLRSRTIITQANAPAIARLLAGVGQTELNYLTCEKVSPISCQMSEFRGNLSRSSGPILS